MNPHAPAPTARLVWGFSLIDVGVTALQAVWVKDVGWLFAEHCSKLPPDIT